MNYETFRTRHLSEWHEFNVLLGLMDSKGVASIPIEDLERFSLLYRIVSTDLVIGRRDFPTSDVTERLNEFCTAAHPFAYRTKKVTREGLGSFVTTAVPRAFRQCRWPILLSLFATLLGVAIGWAMISLHPNLASSLVPDSLFADLAEGKNVPALPGVPLTDLAISTNNIKVVVLAFAGGLIVGIPTAIILYENGFMLGTLAAAIHEQGLDAKFWPYIFPHGVLELSIIVITGGAGFALAQAILLPGRKRRIDALAAAAIPAVILTCGTGVLLLIAGTIESSISPSPLPGPLKVSVGIVVGACFYSWLFLAGRQQQEQKYDPKTTPPEQVPHIAVN